MHRNLRFLPFWWIPNGIPTLHQNPWGRVKYWEFSVLHVNYLYNHTPVQCLNWKIPKEYLDKVKPDLSHLCILG